MMEFQSMLNLHIVIVLACFLNIIRTSAFRLMLTCLSLFNMLRCTFLPDTNSSFCTEDVLNISDMNETHDWGPLFRRQLLEFPSEIRRIEFLKIGM